MGRINGGQSPKLERSRIFRMNDWISGKWVSDYAPIDYQQLIIK